MHSSNSTQWEKVKNRCCHEGQCGETTSATNCLWILDPLAINISSEHISSSNASVPHNKQNQQKHGGALSFTASFAPHKEADASLGEPDGCDRLGPSCRAPKVGASSSSLARKLPLQPCCYFLPLGKRHWRSKFNMQSPKEREADKRNREKQGHNCPFLSLAQGQTKEQPLVCLLWSPALLRHPL